MKKCLFILLLFVVQVDGFGQVGCTTGTDEPPGCLILCSEYRANTQGFTADTTGVVLDCGNSTITQWVQVEAASSVLKVINQSFNCPLTQSINVQIFDKNLNKVSSCGEFKRTNLNTFVQADNLVTGELYSIGINASSESCSFSIVVEGSTNTSSLGATPDIIVEPNSGLFFGSLSVSPVPGATTYDWEFSSGSTTILWGQGTNSIDYSNIAQTVGEVCITPRNDCKSGVKKCINLPFANCTNEFAGPPGCPLTCPSITLSETDFPSNLVPDFDCFSSSFNIKRTLWLSVIAESPTLEIRTSENRLSGSYLRLFDESLNPVSPCLALSIRGTATISDTLIQGDTYYIVLGDSTLTDSITTLTLNVEGHQSFHPATPVVQFDLNSDINSGTAFFDSTFAMQSVLWETSDTFLNIISGQGTNQIEYENSGNRRANICLEVATSSCGTLTKKCRIIPNKVPPGTLCLPSTGGIPAGNDAPGCLLCGPIYQGNTFGYAPSAPGSSGFPCGTVENNHFISIIADSSGTVTGTILTSNCQNNLGVQIIMYDQGFNPVSNCYSSGGVQTPGLIEAQGLTPGEQYYIMIDGFAGDFCDVTLMISGGVHAARPDPPGPISTVPDLSFVCPGTIVCYSIDSVRGATNYNWEIPGNSMIVSGGGIHDTEVCLEYISVGGGIVRVTPDNPCFDGIPALKTVGVLPGFSIVKPPEYVCTGDFPITRDGIVFNSIGSFEIISTTSQGCDSTVTYVFLSNVQTPNIIDTSICLGSCLKIGTQCFDVPTNQTFELSGNFSQTNGCDSIIILNLQIDSTSLILSDFTVRQTVCTNEQISVTYTGNASPTANYNWDFGTASIISGNGAGPYEIIFSDAGGYQITLEVEENGCVSPVTEESIVVNDQLAPFSVNCSSTVDEIIFRWDAVPGATNYRVNVLTGQAGNLNGTIYTVSGLAPNEEVSVEVFAESGLGCAASSTSKICTAQDCPPVTVTILPVGDICLVPNSGLIQLEALQSGGLGGGNYLWSGPGILSSGIFDPLSANIGSNQIEVRYTEGSCEYTATQIIMVYVTPTADFTLGSVACISDEISVNYTGNAGSGATYDWDFGGATILSSVLNNSFQLASTTVGPLDISLRVEENGCVSDVNTKIIQVDEELSPVIISCASATTNSLLFAWNPVQGASGYNVDVLTGQQGVLTGTNYELTGLSPGESVVIEVTAESGNTCPTVSSTLSCVTVDCPPKNISIDPISATVCAGDSMQIQLIVTVTGNNSGNLTWSGQGVSSSGVWSTDGLAAGDYPIEVTYEENGCVYTESRIMSISSGVDLTAEIIAPIWYPGTSGDIEIRASGGILPYTFLWSPFGVTTQNLTDVTPGEYCLTVTDDQGCNTMECYTIGAGIFRTTPLLVFCSGDSKQLSVRPGRGADFAWSPSAGLSCTECPNPLASPDKTTLYEVSATLPDDRSESTKVIAIVLPRFFCNMVQAATENELSSFSENIDFNRISEENVFEIENKLKDYLSENHLKIVPNPTTGFVNIWSLTKVEKTEVFDFSGRKVLVSDVSEIDLSAFAKGVYFFKVKTETGVFLRKVVLI